MFTYPIYIRMLRKNCRSFCLLCATSFFLAMLAHAPVFGDTAAELDLVGQRESAPEESETGPKGRYRRRIGSGAKRGAEHRLSAQAHNSSASDNSGESLPCDYLPPTPD